MEFKDLIPKEDGIQQAEPQLYQCMSCTKLYPANRVVVGFLKLYNTGGDATQLILCTYCMKSMGFTSVFRQSQEKLYTSKKPQADYSLFNEGDVETS